MYSDAKIGGVGIWLDEIVPCLKDTETGEIKETVVFRIESRSFLKKFNEKNGWGIDWIEVPNDVEVFALALKENNEIQGLVGVIFGFALNKELLNHYIGVLGCSHIGALHPYHFILGPIAAKKLLETYTYEWN
jgi:hypothetical protein